MYAIRSYYAKTRLNSDKKALSNKNIKPENKPNKQEKEAVHSRLREFDKPFFLIVIALMVLGLVMT